LNPARRGFAQILSGGEEFFCCFVIVLTPSASNNLIGVNEITTILKKQLPTAYF